ncbi:MAG TPA: hypothetical protein VFV51_11235 [Vicinamibacterales bacterium]|nr:hypothetical protein [Vicinamibacterales bacterium]
MKPLLWKSARYLATVAWAAAGVWLVGMTFIELRAVWLVPPTPPEVSHDLIIRNAKDDAGRNTSFRILLFTDEFRWVINSFDAIEKNGARPHFTEEMKAVLNSAKEIIAVGASSEEIPVGISPAAGRALEERRAARRAEKIALWVREVLGKPIPVRKLNVGHHAPTGAGDTSDQRRVVIILVLDHDEGAHIDESLRAAMSDESARAPIFQALLTKYSLGGKNTFTWVP